MDGLRDDEMQAEIQGHVTTLKGDLQGRVSGFQAQCEASVGAIKGQRAGGEGRLASI